MRVGRPPRPLAPSRTRGSSRAAASPASRALARKAPARPASGSGGSGSSHGDCSGPGARPARRLSPGPRSLSGWGKVGGRGQRGRGRSAPQNTPPPADGRLCLGAGTPAALPPSARALAGPAPRRLQTRRAGLAPGASTLPGVAGGRRRRRGGRGGGGGPGSAAAAAAGGGGRRRERESLAQGEGERDAASEQGAGAGSAGGGGRAREPGGGRTSPMQSSPGAPRSPASGRWRREEEEEQAAAAAAGKKKRGKSCHLRGCFSGGGGCSGAAGGGGGGGSWRRF